MADAASYCASLLGQIAEAQSAKANVEQLNERATTSLGVNPQSENFIVPQMMERVDAQHREGDILRINIEDLGWTEKEWDAVLAVYPYATQPETQQVTVLQGVTGTKMPYVRADWFAATAWVM